MMRVFCLAQLREGKSKKKGKFACLIDLSNVAKIIMLLTREEVEKKK